MDISFRQDLIKKYQWAGKIRFICFAILFLFLTAMKAVGGYAYLNSVLLILIFVEALLNRPFPFLLKKVDLYRFQFYQMTTDIIAISWVIYYLGGIEAPVVNLAYYVIILWAGVVSDDLAVFFAVFVSAVLFSGVVLLSYFGILPRISFFDYKMPPLQLCSLLLGHISFLFAFGYFSARSSKIARALGRRKQEEHLRHTHKFLAAGTLIGAIAHDIVNQLIRIRAYTNVLLEKMGPGAPGDPERTRAVESLKHIEEAEKNSTALLAKLLQFSQKPKEKFALADINRVVDDALALTAPLMKMADIGVAKIYGRDLPPISLDKDEIQEVFVALILNSVDAMAKKGVITIRTKISSVRGFIEVVFSDTGTGIQRDHLERIGEPFFTTKTPDKGVGMGLAIAYEVIARHCGRIRVQSVFGEGAVFTIQLPVTPLNK
jgi:signal transduction histidine kinase